MRTDLRFVAALTFLFAIHVPVFTDGAFAKGAKTKSSPGSEKSSCKVVTVTPTGVPVDFAAPDAGTKSQVDGLSAIVGQISRGFAAGDPEALAALFHPRLKMDAATMKSELRELRARYGDPVSYTALKLMVFQPGQAMAPVPCDFEGVILKPLNGYDYQASFWIQASGQNEIARLMLGLVQVPERLGGGWRIGYFHKQQWTHDGKDPLAWIEAGRAARDAKHPLAAWAMMDLAEKLLRSSNFVNWIARDMVITERDAIMGREKWKKSIAALVPEMKVEDVSSLLASGGAGVFVKLRLAKEVSFNDLDKQCRETVKNLTADNSTTGLVGVRCLYYRPGESLEKESFTGGLFVPVSPPAPAK